MSFADNTGSEKQPYKYNGKEEDTRHGLNLYDYLARQYDGTVPRFTSMDPLAERYYSISPYVYVANNPLKFIDPTGMFYDDYFDLSSGNYLGTDNDPNSSKIRIMDKATWNRNKNENGTIDTDIGQSIAALHSEVGITEKASLNIYQHYNSTELKIESTINAGTLMSYSTVRSSTTNKLKSELFKVNVSENMQLGFADNIYDIKNSFVHEVQHFKDLHINGVKKHFETPKKERKESAIRVQVADPSWNKTSDQFKSNIKGYANSYNLFIPGLNIKFEIPNPKK